MTRNLKALGLALVAMLAMSAVAASSASAWFTSESHNTILTAEDLEPQVLSFTHSSGGKIIIACESVSFTKTGIGTESEAITAFPIYAECVLFVPEVGTVPGFAIMNDCDYTFTTDTEMHIDCPEGKQIEVKGEFVPPFKSKCVDIPEQTPTNPEVHYINQGSGATAQILIEPTVEGLGYTRTGICGSGTDNDGSFSGSLSVTGENIAQEHIGVEGH
jgi:hypothetical protein